MKLLARIPLRWRVFAAACLCHYLASVLLFAGAFGLGSAGKLSPEHELLQDRIGWALGTLTFPAFLLRPVLAFLLPSWSGAPWGLFALSSVIWCSGAWWLGRRIRFWLAQRSPVVRGSEKGDVDGDRR